MNLYPGSWVAGILDWSLWDEDDDPIYGALFWRAPSEMGLLLILA